jgi:hypothetical protein
MLTSPAGMVLRDRSGNLLLPHSFLLLLLLLP